MKTELDIVIVGGGPIGIACGLEAKKNGLKRAKTYLLLLQIRTLTYLDK